MLDHNFNARGPVVLGPHGKHMAVLVCGRTTALTPWTEAKGKQGGRAWGLATPGDAPLMKPSQYTQLLTRFRHLL